MLLRTIMSLITWVLMAQVAQSWADVEKLISEQKFEAANAAVTQRIAAARKKNDDTELAKALLKRTQLRIALAGYETAIKELKAEAWPKSLLANTAVQLYWAHSLIRYYQAYSWEIQQRERVDTRGELDLKAWTGEQIWAEAQRGFEEVWKNREQLGNQQIGALSEYFEANDYPKGIRDTLRDAVTYIRAATLINTSSWTAEQQNELYRLDFKTLAKAPAGQLSKTNTADPSVHPLVRAVAMLDDLENWHTRTGRAEAALNARMERLTALRTHFQAEDERATLNAELESRAKAAAKVPWSSTALGLLSEWLREGGDNLRAHDIAVQGQRAFPQSYGGQRCLYWVKNIEAPDYNLAGIQSDGLERRSLELSARNLSQLFFRAYPMDVESLFSRTQWGVLPQEEEIRKLMASKSPVAKWTVALPKTPDFKSHRTQVVPPMKEYGLFLIVASAREDFADKENRIVAQVLMLTPLVMTVRQNYGDGSLDVVVVKGETGEPVADAEVVLWGLEYGKARTRVETKRTDANGGAQFQAQKQNRLTYLVTARHQKDWALGLNNMYLSSPLHPEVNAAMVYTDRSIYRPQQKILWKVIAYHGSADRSTYKTMPSSNVTVSLMDANHQQVETRTVKTNSYGSASGEFVIPQGRLLGNWSIVGANSSAHIRVEEYKRPTFEVTFKDSAAPMRLNSPATLKGEARYYFGLPVASGQLKWRVKRTPQYPWWWWEWGYRAGPTATQVVAAGASALKPDGTFEFSFKPEADPKLKPEVTYRYEIEADILDEGGETRSAQKNIRLGAVAVEARATLEQGFYSDDAPVKFKVFRSDLDGNPKPGKASCRVVAITQPTKILLPAEEPFSREKLPPGAFQTEDDKRRQRWAPGYSVASTLRSWGDGAEQNRADVEHSAKGEVDVTLPKLAPGAYRIHYETRDEFGSKFETSADFVVSGRTFGLKLPGYLSLQNRTVSVGGKARFLVGGVDGQAIIFERYKNGRRVDRRVMHSGRDAAVFEIPVKAEDRGGFSVAVQVIRDYQVMHFTENVFVPRDDKELKVEFATLRDKLRPGSKETFKVTVKGVGAKLEAGAAEVLAYMYDQSLDLFGPHSPPSALGLYPGITGVSHSWSTLDSASAQWLSRSPWYSLPNIPTVRADELKFYDEYGIGGPGSRRHRMLRMETKGMSADALAPAEIDGALEVGERRKAEMAPAAPAAAPAKLLAKESAASPPAGGRTDGKSEGGAAPVQVRSNFAETAFFKPHLVPDASGAVSWEFQVPDSVTAWNVWAHAVTRDLRGGSVKATTRSVKELMVRPYMPRFLREGDQALLKVVVNNAATTDISGELKLEIFDPETNASLLKEFGVTATAPQSFTVKAGQSSNLSFSMTAPKRVGQVAFRVIGKAGDFSDGELRALPLLPSRMHLVQSKFATLKDKDTRTLTFDDLKKDDDATRINEQMVVTIDAQLFFTVLQSLPYLARYPYECTEQTLNRFVSAGIVSSVFKDHPAVAKMASKFSKRDTPLETFDAMDPNRKIALEEAPWLELAKGGGKTGDDWVNMLDPNVVQQERSAALQKLLKAQLAEGAWPWFPGGPPSRYITLYLVHGFAKAAEFKVDVPKGVVQKAFGYLAADFRGELTSCMKHNGCWEWVTFLNYVVSTFPDESWTGGVFTPQERTLMLDFSFKHWKQHAPYLKGYLALTLKRMGREKDAHLVFDSVMDSAKTTQDEGTFWAPEDRSWLWYNDTIESHAFALRTMTELAPKDARRSGLVQWLLLNKKMNQWKSTRATAEVIYSLVKFLQSEGTLAVREESLVEVGPMKKEYVFLPDEYTGKKNQWVIPGSQIDPKTMSSVKVSKSTKGFQFASATWHFSTDQMPKEARGDLFSVSRTYFRREKGPKDVTLKPLADGAKIQVGDELEVQLSIRSKAPAEYVHVKDPRGAGFEPEGAVSKYHWNMGLYWYEEYRDSSTNFFFESVPVGEFTFKYRVRAAMAGTFRVGPAVMQSMYAPEFTAYSQGHIVPIVAGGH